MNNPPAPIISYPCVVLNLYTGTVIVYMEHNRRICNILKNVDGSVLDTIVFRYMEKTSLVQHKGE